VATHSCWLIARPPQRPVALEQCAGLRQGRFGTRLGGQGAVQRCAVGGVVDLEQALPGLHDGAFIEQALLDHARDPRTHLRGAPGFEPARQFGGDCQGGRLHRHHTDLRRWHLAARAGGTCAALATSRHGGGRHHGQHGGHTRAAGHV
jgi:hypothetical protein